MRTNWKFYEKLGKKFCIFALISLFIFSIFASFCINFYINSKTNSTFNENRPIHSSAETIIQNQVFSSDVNILAQNIRYINCTFLRYVYIRSNSTDQANVTFTDCHFLNVVGTALAVYDDSNVVFWNKTGENSIELEIYVWLYDNCTLIINETNLGNEGNLVSINLEDNARMVFINSTYNLYSYLGMIDQSKIEMHRTFIPDSERTYLTMNQNATNFAEASTLYFYDVLMHDDSALILNNSYINIDDQVTMSERSRMLLINHSSYYIPWWVTPWIMDNAQLDCINSTISVEENMYLVGNAVLNFVEGWYSMAQLYLNDNVTLSFIDSTCAGSYSSGTLFINGGSPKLIFNNSIVNSKIELAGAAQTPQINFYQSNFTRLFYGFYSYNHNTSVTIIECNSEIASYEELSESNAFGKNSTVFISNSRLDKFGVTENCTLTVINTTIAYEFGLYSGTSNSYLSTNLKNVQMGKLINRLRTGPLWEDCKL